MKTSADRLHSFASCGGNGEAINMVGTEPLEDFVPQTRWDGQIVTRCETAPIRPPLRWDNRRDYRSDYSRGKGKRKQRTLRSHRPGRVQRSRRRHKDRANVRST